MDQYRPLPGTPISELETPCLLVDLDALESNYRVVAETYRDTKCKMRQHIKNVKSPVLARMQMEAGGTVGGVCTAKVAEAEVMVENGITDIFIPNQIGTRDKLDRLCALARQGDIKIGIDNTENLRDISEAAVANEVEIGVIIEVDTNMRRGGIRRIDQGIELARLAMELPGVAFKGVMSHQDNDEDATAENRHVGARREIQKCIDVRNAIVDVGIPVEVVSTGETFSYATAPEFPDVTEVEGGTYALMSTGWQVFCPEFELANKVLATVVSTPRPRVAVVDAGWQAATLPMGKAPTIEGMPEVVVEKTTEDHSVLRSEGEIGLNVGDQIMFLPWYQDQMINRWDTYIAVRDDVVEQVWDVSARGCYH